MLEDSLHRNITYLRISVTDRCNLRCIYCMPSEGIEWQPHDNILSYEEISEIARVAVSMGVNSIRLTGGDPLVRDGIVHLIRLLADIPGVKDLSMTTNGLLLKSMANDLSRAGLNRVNVSLDTLNKEKFATITRGGSLERVLEGLNAAEEAGLHPIKTNTVVLRGVNEDELKDLAQLSMIKPWHIRFIEYMPVNHPLNCNSRSPFQEEIFLSTKEMMNLLKPLELEPVQAPSGYGPAREFQIRGGLGTIGFISPISNHFCHQCNRLRLTADGNLRPCLLNDLEVPLRQILRSGGDVHALIEQAVKLKPLCHSLNMHASPLSRYMQQIGG